MTVILFPLTDDEDGKKRDWLRGRGVLVERSLPNNCVAALADETAQEFLKTFNLEETP